VVSNFGSPAPPGKNFVPDASILPHILVFNLNFLAPVLSEIIEGPKFTLRGPAPPGRTSENFLTHPQVLAYTYLAVKFHLRSSINV